MVVTTVELHTGLIAWENWGDSCTDYVKPKQGLLVITHNTKRETETSTIINKENTETFRSKVEKRLNTIEIVKK